MTECQYKPHDSSGGCLFVIILFFFLSSLGATVARIESKVDKCLIEQKQNNEAVPRMHKQGVNHGATQKD